MSVTGNEEAHAEALRLLELGYREAASQAMRETPPEVYLVVIQDQIVDAQVEVFRDATTAIAFAKERATAYAAASAFELEEIEMEGHLYAADFSSEGGFVLVVAKELW